MSTRRSAGLAIDGAHYALRRLWPDAGGSALVRLRPVTWPGE
jgi:hypothetical protein